MSVGLYNNGMPEVERIPVSIDETEEIQCYGLDNLYPQMIERVQAGSGTCKTSVNRLAKFSRGQGFENLDFGKIIINPGTRQKKSTVDQALMFSAHNRALFMVQAYHVQYNLNYRISSVTPIFSKYCRLGVPDENGNVREIKYSTNWEDNPDKELENERTIYTFDVFNPKAEVVANQIKKAGGIRSYKGQIFYSTELENTYPAVLFDPVLDDVQTEAEIKLYNLRQLQNGFSSRGIFIYPGEPETETEKKKIINKVNEHSGAANAGNSLVLFNANPELIDPKTIFHPIETPNVDVMYKETRRAAKENIFEVFAIPTALTGISPDGGVFNSEDIANAFRAYNAVTTEDRAVLQNDFWTLFNPEYSDLGAGTITEKQNIKPLEFETNGSTD
jgi:hypothetical protein